METLVAAGFDAAWLTKLVSEHGMEVLQLIQDAVAKGFTTDYLVEVLQTVGPIGIEVVTHLFGNGPTAAPSFGAIIEGQPDDSLPVGPPADPMSVLQIMQVLLPLITQYGPQLAQLIGPIQAILPLLVKYGPQVVSVIQLLLKLVPAK